MLCQQLLKNMSKRDIQVYADLSAFLRQQFSEDKAMHLLFYCQCQTPDLEQILKLVNVFDEIKHIYK